MLEEKGIEYNYFEMDKMNHVFQIYPIPEAKMIQKQIVDIIKR